MKTLKTILLTLLALPLAAQEPGLVNSNGAGITNPAFRNAVLPTQTSHAGKYLKTDGSSATWESVSGGSFATLTGQPSDNANLSSALGLKVDTSLLSATGGNSKVPQYDASGYLKLGTTGQSTGGLRVPSPQRLSFEDDNGNIGGFMWLYPDHPLSTGGVGEELIYESDRHCFYWSDAIQMGSAGSDRGNHHVYFNRLGNATDIDPIRESVPVLHAGTWYNGTTYTYSYFSSQWVPQQAAGQGEYAFSVATGAAMTGGKINTATGANKVFGITHDGPSIPLGKSLIFNDGSISSLADIETLAEGVIPAVRTGSVDLVAGEADVADASVTNKTHIQLSHQVIDGTPGFLGYELAPATGFTITSSSATDTSRVTYLLTEGEDVNIPPAPAPTISGNNEITDTLTVTSNGGNETYQWYSGNDAVSGETGTTYVIRPTDIGKAITCQEGGIASNVITAWHPDDESGYYAEYRAETGLNKAGGGLATVDGDEISQWDDVSGNARHMSHATAGEYPKLDTSEGGNRVEFDVNDYLHKTSLTPALPQTAFVVAKADSSVNQAVIFSTGDSSFRMRISQTLGGGVANVNATGATMTNGVKYVLTGGINSTAYTIQSNNGTIYSNTETTATGNKIGLGSLGGNQSFVGSVYHVIFYAGGTELNAAAKTRVKKYLYAKHSITP